MIINAMRNKSFMKGIMFGVLVLVLPSFVLFYGYSKHEGGPRIDALVTLKTPEGKEVSLSRDDMVMAKNELVDYLGSVYTNVTGQPASRELGQALSSGLENVDAARHAVARYALQERVAKEQVMVSTHQVSRYLTAMGVTRQMLDQILASGRMTEREYQANIAASLQRSRAEDTVRRVARTSLLEMWNEYRVAEEKLTGAVVTLKVDDYLSSATIAESELQPAFERYAKAYPKEYTKGAERVYEYVKLPAPRMAPPAAIDDARIAAAYAAVKPGDPDYTAGTGARVRHVLIGIDPVVAAGTPELTAARMDAQMALDRIASGEEFGKVADEVSTDLRNMAFTDPDTSPTLRGGLIPRPLSAKEDAIWGAAYAEWIRSAKPGDVSGIIETPQGFVIAKMEERGENLKRRLEEVRPLLEQKLAQEDRTKARQDREAAIEAQIDKLRAAIAQESSLEGIARAVNGTVERTSPTLATQTFIPIVGSFSREASALEDLEPNVIGPALRSDSGDAVVLRIVERFPERPMTFEEAKASVRRRLTRERAAEMAKARAEEIRAALRADDMLTTYSLNNNIPFVAFDEPFTRSTLPPELAQIPNAGNRTLRAKPMEAMVFEVGSKDAPTAFAVVQFTSIASPDPATFTQNLGNVERSLAAGKRQAFLEDFYEDALSKYRASIHPDFVPPEEAAKLTGQP